MSKISGRLDVLREAAEDVRYLLNRGYNKESSIKLVGDRYRLSREERLILFRSVFSMPEAELIKSKRVDASSVKDQSVLVDGFNVLNTVESALRGDELILGDDGVLRDISQIYGKYRLGPLTEVSISLVVRALASLAALDVLILYDSQISRSGEIAWMTRKALSEWGVRGTAETARNVDSRLAGSYGVVCSSDSAILLRCSRHFDLAAHIVNTMIMHSRTLTLAK